MPATMTAPQPALPNATGPAPYRWTCDEYRTLRDSGRFQDRRVMLIHGVILTMPMPDPPHNLSVGLADDWLRTVFAVGYHVRSQMAFDVGTENDPGPDLAVVAGTRRDYAAKQATAAVLVIEVADSSLTLDTTEKAELYATAGVQDYWVIEVENRQLHVFREPVPLPEGLGATAYRKRDVLGPSDRISPLAAPNASILVSDLLP